MDYETVGATAIFTCKGCQRIFRGDPKKILVFDGHPYCRKCADDMNRLWAYLGLPQTLIAEDAYKEERGRKEIP